MMKIVGGVFFVLVCLGLWWASNKAKTAGIREGVEESFVKQETDGDFLDRLRALYRKGGKDDKDLASRMLVSISVPKKAVGSWEATGVVETLKAKAGTASSVKLSPTNDLRLSVDGVVWGEQTSIGLMETAAWASYVLVNQSDTPVPVSRGFLMIHAGDARFASTGFGEEHGDEPSIAPKTALKSASRFAVVGSNPTHLEFNNGKQVVRTICPGSQLITNFQRTASGWPDDAALKNYPVRTPFSEQMLSSTDTAPYIRDAQPAAAVAAPETPATDAPEGTSAGEPEYRIWTNTKGETVKAALVGQVGTVLTLRRASDKQEFEADIRVFGEADRAYVESLATSP